MALYRGGLHPASETIGMKETHRLRLHSVNSRISLAFGVALLILPEAAITILGFPKMVECSLLVAGMSSYLAGRSSDVHSTRRKAMNRRNVFLVTNVYEKIDDRWLMVSHHVQPKPE